jgi:hypothetical protein
MKGDISTIISLSAVKPAFAAAACALALTACVVQTPPSPEAAGTTPTATVTVTQSPAATADPTAGQPRDARLLRPGLFCKDLAARGYSYAQSVEYWDAQDQPDRMDADANGTPCETVYSAAEVAAYYSKVPAARPDVKPGLLCRDLRKRGVSLPAAVAYWLSEGSPDRMDADGNGVPCETVYPASAIASYYGETDASQDDPLPLPAAPSAAGRDLGPGSGYTVTCADGAISHAGGRQGACSYHGGVG